jgi:hypothetical protein
MTGLAHALSPFGIGAYPLPPRGNLGVLARGGGRGWAVRTSRELREPILSETPDTMTCPHDCGQIHQRAERCG